MALFRFLQRTGRARPRGDGVLLRAPQMSDFPQWAALREASRAFLTPWEPTWPADDLTRAAFRRRLRRYAEDIAPTRPIRSSCSARRRRLVGGLTLANIRRGVAQAGSLGYWIGEPYAAPGLDDRGGAGAGAVAFGALRLHRLEAACIPSNVASIRLLEKTGFPREGYARQYSASTGSGRTTCCSPCCRGFPRLSRLIYQSPQGALGSPPLGCYKAAGNNDVE